MPKTRGQKKAISASIDQKIKASKSIVFTSFNGLTVSKAEDLRSKLKAENSEYLVAKKTLLKLALAENNINDVDAKGLDGKVAVVFGYQDEVTPAKIVDEFMKTNDGTVTINGGILENRFISREQVVALAKLPSKLELLSKLVGTINAPVSGFVNVLAGNLRGFVTVLKAIEEKKA